MTDIVERLRNPTLDLPSGQSYPALVGQLHDAKNKLMNEAADEIEELRNDLADARLMIDEWQAKADRRADETARLHIEVRQWKWLAIGRIERNKTLKELQE